MSLFFKVYLGTAPSHNLGNSTGLFYLHVLGLQTMYKKTMYVRNIDLPLSAKLPKCKQVSHTLNTWIHTYTYEHILYRYRYYTSNMDPETVHLLNREKIILEQHIDLHVKFARCTLHDRRARKNIWNIHMKPLINSCFCWWFLLKKQDVLFFFLGRSVFSFCCCRLLVWLAAALLTHPQCHLMWRLAQWSLEVYHGVAPHAVEFLILKFATHLAPYDGIMIECLADKPFLGPKVTV